jgi:hypothetical protein
MPIRLLWFLPTDGDSRSDLSLGAAVGADKAGGDREGERAPELGYLAQVARAAEALGFAGALTPNDGGRTDDLEVSPNLWAGIGLVRGGAGTALVGSHEEVGVTDILTMPWAAYSGRDAPLDQKIEGLARFYEDIVAPVNDL